MGLINKVFLAGNLGNDPDVMETEKAVKVAKFSIATGGRYTDKDGNEKDNTSWHHITAFGQLAGSCEKHLAKGARVFVEGRLEENKWEDEQGNQRRSVAIIAVRVEFGSPKENRE